MRRKRILTLATLLASAPLVMAQQPPSSDPGSEDPAPAQADIIGPVLSEDIPDSVIWPRKSAPESDEGFIPSEAISADAAIAFPVDI